MKTLKQRLRKIWLQLHFHLGLWLGMVFVVAGISGSLLVFYVDIDQWLNPQIAVHAQGKPQPLAAVLAALKAGHPQRQGAWRLELPMDSDQPVMARYYKPDETRHLGFAPLTVSVNPYSLEISSKRFWGETLMTWIYDLHYLLLINNGGATMIGVAGLLLALALLSGLYLWWPAHANWRSAFRLRWRAGSIRRTYDLHKFGGIVGAPVLLVVALSGFALDLPAWANPLINWFSPLSTTPHLMSDAHGVKQVVSIDSALAVAQARFPQAEVRWVETPKDDAGTYLVRLYQQGEPGRRFPKTMVWVDQYSGKLLAQQDARQRSGGDGLLAWLHPLHSGEAFGLAGRSIVLLSGLILPLMFVTGLLRWQQKQRAKRHVARRNAQS